MDYTGFPKQLVNSLSFYLGSFSLRIAQVFYSYVELCNHLTSQELIDLKSTGVQLWNSIL